MTTTLAITPEAWRAIDRSAVEELRPPTVLPDGLFSVELEDDVIEALDAFCAKTQPGQAPNYSAAIIMMADQAKAGGIQ